MSEGAAAMGLWRNLIGRLDGWTTWCGGVVADGATAYLQGRLLEHQRMLGPGARTPPWMWLNGVAHGDLDRLTELAADAGPATDPVSSWRTARSLVARELLDRCGNDPHAVRAVQLQLLVPLEGRLSARRDLTPTQLHAIVVQELRPIGF